jgi:hypothetical protein
MQKKKKSIKLQYLISTGTNEIQEKIKKVKRKANSLYIYTHILLFTLTLQLPFCPIHKKPMALVVGVFKSFCTTN